MSAEHHQAPSSGAVRLRDEALIIVRPIVPEDKQLLLDVFEQLSEESLQSRFFMKLRELSPAMLVDFTEVDHSGHDAVIAIEPSSGRALGVARYGRFDEDRWTAEVAVAVVDDWHRRGVARALLAELSARAQREGFRRFVAVVRTSNRGAVTLFSSVSGSRLRRPAGAVLEFEIELEHVNGWSSTRR